MSPVQLSPQGFSSTETLFERQVGPKNTSRVRVSSTPLQSSPFGFPCPTTTTLKRNDLPTNPSLPTSFRAILSASTEELPWAMLAKGPACTKTGVPCGSRRTNEKPQRQMEGHTRWARLLGTEKARFSHPAFIETTSLMPKFSQRKLKKPRVFQRSKFLTYPGTVLILHLMLNQGEKALRASYFLR